MKRGQEGCSAGFFPIASLCFTVYINDLPSVIRHCQYHLYTDDLQVYLQCTPDAITNAISSQNADIAAIAAWSTANGLSLNGHKTQLILLGRREVLSTISPNALPPLIFNGDPTAFGYCFSLWTPNIC